MSGELLPTTSAIPGDPAQILATGSAVSAVAHAAGQAGHAVHNHRRQLDGFWQSRNAGRAQLELSGAGDQLHTAHHDFVQAAGILHRHAAEVEAAQRDYTAALTEAQTLATEIAATPTPALQADMVRVQARMHAAIQRGKRSTRRTVREIDALVPKPLPVTPKGHLDAGEALLIDGAITQHHLSRRRGIAAANRLATMGGSDARTFNHLLDTAGGSAGGARALNLLGGGASVKKINTLVGRDRFFSLQGPGEKLNGKTSWFGGPSDGSDSGTTASGIPESVPGIAVYNQSTLRGYWLVEFPNGKKLVLQQTDIGPAPWTGRKVDILYSALPAAGYSQGNFPTDSTVHARYLGMSVPPGVATR